MHLIGDLSVWQNAGRVKSLLVRREAPINMSIMLRACSLQGRPLAPSFFPCNFVKLMQCIAYQPTQEEHGNLRVFVQLY